MDKRTLSRQRKHINLKNIRKYALERFKRLRDQNPQQQNNEAGTSSIQEEEPEVTTTTTENCCLSAFKLNDHHIPSTLLGNPNSELVGYQHSIFLNHRYTDVVVERVELKKMANDTYNETKPLTQAYLTQKPKVQPKYDVHRDVLTHEVVIKQTGYSARDKSIPYALRQCWKNWSFLALFTGIVPILQWLPKYSWKRDFIGDVIAGFTVAIMNIPHGMAYGLLAGVSPGNGLYMAIFPVLVYLVLGTSRHISIGTFAVISMMTLKVVHTYATEEGAVVPKGSIVIKPEEVVTSLALTVGLVHLAMGFLRLGTLAALLSDPLVNGFTTGAACHVITSQLKDIIGVSIPRQKGAFKIIYTVIDLCKSLPETNLAALLFCLCIIFFMAICNEVLKPYLRKRCRIPLPAELIAVIGGTLISKFLDVEGHYNVTLVGVIPKGLPSPEFPRIDLIPKVTVDAIAIAIVSYSVVMSMGLTFAKKHSYEVRANQELFALGVGNVVGGCFSCIPLACSLSRSVIQEQTGGASQLASLVSALLILVTLLWAGPFFSDLPRCVLAGVIVVALKPMFMQAKELKKFSKQGKLELFTWLATFLSVVFIDIDIGLLIGVCISLLALYIKGSKPYSSLLGFIPEASAIYVDIKHHRNAIEVPETKIFRYSGSLNFATSMFFRRALYDTLQIDFQKPSTFTHPTAGAYMPIQQNGNIVNNGDTTVSTSIEEGTIGSAGTGTGTGTGAGSTMGNGTTTVGMTEYLNTFRFLILDFSMMGHMDVAGCSTLTDIMKEMNAHGIRLFLASTGDRIYDTIMHSMALSEGPFEIFPTLHDAVEYANACRLT